MMDFAAKNIGFVFAAYAITAFVLGALIVYVFARDRKLARKLEQSKKS